MLWLGKVGAQSGPVLSHYEIKAAREAAGLSQRELAKLVGVSKNSILNWESGRTKPRGKESRLRQVLGLHDGPPAVRDAEAASAPLDPDTIAAALRQASHLQILAELATRIQAAQEPGRELPPIPQVHLEWPMHADSSEKPPDQVDATPDQPIDRNHRR